MSTGLSLDILNPSGARALSMSSNLITGAIAAFSDLRLSDSGERTSTYLLTYHTQWYYHANAYTGTLKGLGFRV